MKILSKVYGFSWWTSNNLDDIIKLMYRLLYLKKIKNIYSNQMHDKSNKAKNTKKGWYYMMIKAIFIKNFKAYEKSTINLFENNIFIGENDSGKSTILQAMDVFFNQDSIDKKFVRDINQNVEIGIRIDDNNKFIKLKRLN